jgi:sensor histidine kinase YesM
LLLIFKLFEINLSAHIFINYEIYFCLFGCLVTLFLSGIDIINNKTKTTGLNLIIDFVLITLSFIASYQIVFLFVMPEILKPGILEIQWLFIPLSVVAYRFYVNYSQKRISTLLSEKELELSKQKEIVLKTELLALQSRINPHFLYNALNSIASLVHINADKTEKMTLALAKLFRYNINKGAEIYSTIEQEIDIVKIYLDVELVRFSDRLKYSIDVDKDLFEMKIPVFLLQPLVENAIKHGISKLTENGFIQIKIYSENNWLIISVYDNGPDFPSDIMSNYGLQSVFDKLALLYKDDFKVNFINSPEKNIRIEIKK